MVEPPFHISKPAFEVITMKQRILQSIYQSFDGWASQINNVCQQGCATCCTQDVTMTAIEGEGIFHFIKANHMEEWLAERLGKGMPAHRPVLTTNDFARACLNGEDGDPGMGRFNKTCPFLKENICSIYEARPFSCRCFASTETCRSGTSASVPQYYLAATTAVSQIVEHLGQREFWGNMLHILYLLAQQAGNNKVGDLLNDRQQLILAQTSILTAQVLPGFLISEDDYPLVKPLLEQIFNTEIEGRRVEDILNGRQTS